MQYSNLYPETQQRLNVHGLAAWSGKLFTSRVSASQYTAAVNTHALRHSPEAPELTQLSKPNTPILRAQSAKIWNLGK